MWHPFGIQWKLGCCKGEERIFCLPTKKGGSILLLILIDAKFKFQVLIFFNVLGHFVGGTWESIWQFCHQILNDRGGHLSFEKRHQIGWCHKGGRGYPNLMTGGWHRGGGAGVFRTPQKDDVIYAQTLITIATTTIVVKVLPLSLIFWWKDNELTY